MDKLLSDSAQVEFSARVKDILRALIIDDWQSEANYQHQNFAERRWQHVKKNLNWYMNHRNVDPEAWLLCIIWIADVMNHTAEKSLGWRMPLEVLTGETVDISILLCFLFWDVVYVSRYKDKSYKGLPGSAKSSEIRGRFVGFAWSVGHGLTFKVLTDDSKRIICRSRLRLANEGENNLKLDMEAGAVPSASTYTPSEMLKEEIYFPPSTCSTAHSPSKILRPQQWMMRMRTLHVPLCSDVVVTHKKASDSTRSSVTASSILEPSCLVRNSLTKVTPTLNPGASSMMTADRRSYPS